MPESNDKQYEQAMNDILAIYAQAEKEMLEKVAKRVAKGITTEGWNETKLKDTQKLNKELAELMAKANQEGQKKVAVEAAKGYLKSKHITYKETAEIIKKEGFKIGSGKVSGNTWGKAGYFTDKDTVLDFYGGLMTKGKKNQGKETEVIEQYIKLGKTKEINLMYGSEAGNNDTSAFWGSLHHDNMYIEAAKQLDPDARDYFFEQIKNIKTTDKVYISKETGLPVHEWDMTPEQKSNKSQYFIEKPNYYVGTKFDELKKTFNDTIKKFKYDTLQIKSDNGYVGYDQTVVLNSKSLVSKEEGTKVVDEVLEKMSYQQLLDEAPIPMNLKQLVMATNGLIENATFQVLRSANDAYQRVMANGTTGLLAGVDTRIQATQKMLNEYASKGITSFVDKAGRNWNLSTYAEMCARTVSAQAALQGHLDRQNEVGEDLVKVSSIGTTCPICQRWQGVVLSVSGKHPKYHGLEEAKAAGLFHPNCKHTYGLYIEELDGPGKVEPEPYNPNTTSSKRYDMTQKQRANERQIRYWKNRKALAITPEQEKFCNDKIKAWQYKNLIHCEKNNLRRQYAREGVRVGNSAGAKGTLIGGNLKEYEEVFKNVVGDNPKNIFKMNLQFFASDETYEQWLKDEIQSLDELDVDKAMMKDANNKNVTPTTLYKKYIGDNPGQDYFEVSPYEKGTKEYKSGYAKWLKEQIDEIGVSYKIKPKYVEVHEDVTEEDKALSATNIYKKYYGEAPTEAYKKLGGESGTGMKYGKWVETQKKELIKNGITKTVPFGNTVTQKTASTISQATKGIDDAKIKLYKSELDSTVHGQYDGYLKVKEQMEVFKKDMSDTLESEKLDLAKAKHLEMVKKKAEKTYGYSSFENDIEALKIMEGKETDPLMKAHIKNQIGVYEDVKALHKSEEDHKKKINDATVLLADVKMATTSWTFGELKDLIKYNFDDKDVADIYGEAYKFKMKASITDKLNSNHDDLSHYEQNLDIIHEELEEEQNKDPKSVKSFTLKSKYKGYKEAIDEFKAEQEKKKKEAEEAAKKFGNSGKVSLGRETSFKDGKLIKRDEIYQELNKEDLEKLSEQVKGHTMFAAENRRDILGRDLFDGHNHHLGHKVKLKSGLKGDDKELGEAFALAYDEYFNTIKCGPINEAYLKGYDNATPAMQKKIDAINKCIQSVELNEPIVLHRYIDSDLVDAIFKTTDVATLRPGSLYENNTFMSTSTGGHPTFGKRKYMITLQVDKGSHALPTINHEELEVLLGKGKLEVVRTNKYTSSNPNRLQNYDGSYTNFTGDEIVVRYIEDGRAKQYEEITPDKMNEILHKETGVPSHQMESTMWIGKLASKEKKAIVDYTGNWYTKINNVYRRSIRDDNKVVKYAEDMTQAFRRVATDTPLVIRRGIHREDLAHMLGFNGDYSQVEAHWDEINEGIYAAEDKGFLSCSPFSDGGFDKAVELKIYCPVGTHAAYVAPISNFKSEQETLLQSGSIYKVHKVAKEKGKIVAYIELLGTD